MAEIIIGAMAKRSVERRYELLKEAHIDVLTLNVFAWHLCSHRKKNMIFRVWMRLWNWLESMDFQSALQHLQRHIRHGWQKISGYPAGRV